MDDSSITIFSELQVFYARLYPNGIEREVAASYQFESSHLDSYDKPSVYIWLLYSDHAKAQGAGSLYACPKNLKA